MCLCYYVSTGTGSLQYDGRPGSGGNQDRTLRAPASVAESCMLFPGLPLSPYFETNNRGFKCLTLDIQKKKGLEILYKLVKDADIFAENFRPGVAERHHFAYEDLEKINPGIIYLSSSAYGPDGPNAMLPGTDGVAQAAGGIASLFGEKGSRMMTRTAFRRR